MNKESKYRFMDVDLLIAAGRLGSNPDYNELTRALAVRLDAVHSGYLSIYDALLQLRKAVAEDNRARLIADLR